MKIQILNKYQLINGILLYGAHLKKNPDSLIFHDNLVLNEFYAKFHLPLGKSTFEYKEVPLTVLYEVSDEIVGTAINASRYRKITIEGDGDSDFFKDFFKDAREYAKIKKEKTEIVTYVFKGSYWSVLSKLPKRPVNTLYLPDNMLDDTVKDIAKFFTREKLYNRLGIPYKRNFLLEGIHGAGKTSLIYTIASHFDMDLSVMNFNLDVDDATFMQAVSLLNDNSILVLEDIDALFVERKVGDSNKSMISFSGILNTLDGMGRKNKQLTFLTTNYKNKLDKAMIRPGRIDKIITFTYAKIEQIEKMFFNFFPGQTEKWKLFKKKIKRIKTTIAVLQEFFFKYLEEGDILENIDELKKLSSDNDIKEKKDLYT